MAAHVTLRPCHDCGEVTDHFRCDRCQLEINRQLAADLLGTLLPARSTMLTRNATRTASTTGDSEPEAARTTVEHVLPHIRNRP